MAKNLNMFVPPISVCVVVSLCVSRLTPFVFFAGCAAGFPMALEDNVSAMDPPSQPHAPKTHIEVPHILIGSRDLEPDAQADAQK